jgi:hypothetical protein
MTVNVAVLLGTPSWKMTKGTEEPEVTPAGSVHLLW